MALSIYLHSCNSFSVLAVEKENLQNLITHWFAIPFHSPPAPPSLPYKILTAREAVRWGLPRDVHTLAQQPAADNRRVCSLREQHDLESLLYVMTNFRQSNGKMIYF